jgi:hypothetical protein
MRRSILGTALFVAALSVGSAGCDENTPTTPNAPGPLPTTERFTGSIGVNGAIAFPFSTASSGTISLTLTTVTPDNTAIVGLSVGTWNGTACSVSTGVFNDNAQQGITVVAAVSSAGFNNVCARVYDSGKLTAGIGFEITVVRP